MNLKPSYTTTEIAHYPHQPASCENHGRGFTLIELLIVAAVIGILAAIAGGNYVEAIHRADSTACMQSLRTIHTALLAYRADCNRFPPADGIADTRPRPDATAWGCGPSANGYWSGVSLLLAKGDYCPEETLYCPALKRAHHYSVEAYPTCGDSSLVGKNVPAWRFLRFAYNNAAVDVGGSAGGESNIERDWGVDVWLVRCLHVDVEPFDPERAVRFPFRFEPDDGHPGLVQYGEYELTLHGTILERPVRLRKR